MAQDPALTGFFSLAEIVCGPPAVVLAVSEDPDDAIPDPQSKDTFERSRISHPAPDPFYAKLIRLRRELPRELDVSTQGNVLTLRRGHATLVADFGAKTVELHA